jgi:hypothetical protein
MSTHPESGTRNEDVAFEREDIRATPVLRFLVGIAVTTTVVCFLLLGFYRGMRSYVASQQPPPPHLKFEERREPVGPRLQTQEAEDYQAVARGQEELLTTYGWVDQEQGVVRIPIEEAIKLVAERGVAPAAPAGAAR